MNQLKHVGESFVAYDAAQAAIQSEIDAASDLATLGASIDDINNDTRWPQEPWLAERGELTDEQRKKVDVLE